MGRFLDNGTAGFGTHNVAGTYNGQNCLIVKYNSAGACQWARSVTEGNNINKFGGVTVNSEGHIYAVGSQSGTGYYKYGDSDSLRIAGTATYPADVGYGGNAVIVKYLSD